MANLQSLMLPQTGLQAYNPEQKKKKQSFLKTALQFGVPVAGSLAGGLVGGPIGMVAGGAGAAGLLNLLGGGRENENPLQAAQKDALYSVLGLGVGKLAGPIVGKVGGKLIGKTAGEAAEGGGKLGKLGSNIRGSVYRPDVNKGALYETNVDELQRIAKEVFGFKGGPRAVSRQAAGAADNLSGLVQQELTTGGSNKIKLADLKNIFKQNTDLIPAYNVASDKPFAKSLATQLSKLAKSKDVQGLYELKSKLPVSKIFPKLEAGQTLTQNEAAILVAHQTASDAIEKFGSPAIRTLNQLQNKLNPIAIGAQKEAERTAAFPVIGALGSPIKGAAKATQDMTGRTLQDLGTAGQSTLGRAAAPAGAALGAGIGGVTDSASQQAEQIPPEATMGLPNGVPTEIIQGSRREAILGLADQGVPPAEMLKMLSAQGGDISQEEIYSVLKSEGIISPDNQAIYNPTTSSWEPLQTVQDGLPGMGGMGEGTANTLAQLALTSFLQGNTKASDQFAQLAGLFKGLTPQLSAEQQKQAGKLNSLSTSLDVLEQNLTQVQGRGRVSGTFGKVAAGLTGGAYATETADYEALRQGLIGPVARAISSEVGVLTDKDIKRAEELLPRVTDSPQLAQQKLDNIRLLISENAANLEPMMGGGLETLQQGF